MAAALVLLTAALGIGTQAVLAAALGLSGASDAYFSALSFTTMILAILSASVVNRGVPALAHHLDSHDAPTPGFWAAAGRLSRGVFAIALVTAVIVFVVPQLGIALVAPGLRGTTHELAVTSLRIMALPLGFNLASTAFYAILYALRRPAVAQSAAPLYALMVIPSLIWLTPAVGPLAPAIGTGLAFVLMFVALAISTQVAARQPRSLLPAGRSSVEPPPLALVVLAAVLSYAWQLVGPIIASTLGEGAIAQVTFAFRPVEVLSRALPWVVGYTVMPTLAAAHSRDDWTHIKTTALEAQRVVLSATVPVGALLFAVREPLVVFLYQRAAFSAEAARAVIPTLGWYALSLPGFGLIILATLTLLSVGRAGSAVLLGAAFVVAQVPLGVLLGRAFGGSGVAASFCAAAALVAVAGALTGGRRHVGRLSAAGWLGWTLLAAAGALVVGGAASEVSRPLPNLPRLLLSGALGAAAALAALAAGHDPLVVAGRDTFTALARGLARRPRESPAATDQRAMARENTSRTRS